jgi:hypothetical protein
MDLKTGILGLKQLHYLCARYPVAASGMVVRVNSLVEVECLMRGRLKRGLVSDKF